MLYRDRELVRVIRSFVFFCHWYILPEQAFFPAVLPNVALNIQNSLAFSTIVYLLLLLSSYCRNLEYSLQKLLILHSRRWSHPVSLREMLTHGEGNSIQETPKYILLSTVLTFIWAEVEMGMNWEMN